MTQVYLQVFMIIGLYVALMIAVYAYKFFSTEGNIKAYYKKRLIINSIALPLVPVAWFVIAFFNSTSSLDSLTSSSGVGSSLGSSRGAMPVTYQAPTIDFYNGNNSTVSDTREFIKKSFNATLRTRRVEDTAMKVEVLIKGMDGRIDSSNVSEKYANIGFVVPKSKLADFEAQLRTYTNKKFYTQSVSSQNLLSEKKNIERNQNQTSTSIDSLTASKNLSQSNYTKRANYLKGQISSKTTAQKNAYTSISALEASLQGVVDANYRTTTEAQISQLYQTATSLNNDISRARADLNTTEALFKSEMAKIDLSLKQQNETLSGLDKTEGEFFDKIETVQGYVSLRYISIWEILALYSPINPIFIVVIIGVIIRMYFLNRREKQISIL